MHMAGSSAPQLVTEAGLRRMIEEAGRVPVERDTIYRAVRPAEIEGAQVPPLDDVPHALREALLMAWRSS
jgi:hypothetical protein